MIGENQKYLLALNRHSLLGAKRLLDLKNAFGDWRKVWLAQEGELRHNCGDAIAEAVLDARSRFDPENELEIADRVGFSVIEHGGKGYPTALNDMPDPPALLYVKGTLDSLEQPRVAVVGSRRATQYGYHATQEVFEPVARAGITIVSGLALGIDTAAHKAALEGGGKTVGVLGCGLDQVYPTANIGLAQRMVEHGGGLISEFAPGLPSYRSNFPQRNRIIAALATLVVVVEAMPDSGALITAKAALEYNREVGAVPADINRPQAQGPLNLIKMGAVPITSADDVLVAMGLEPGIESKEVSIDYSTLSQDEQEILANLSRQPQHIDIISKATTLSSAATNAALTLLEVKGLVKNLGGNLFIKK